MKITLSILILTIMSLSIVSAQQDTVYVTTDSLEIQNFNKDKKYQYIDHNLIERRTIYKFGIQTNFQTTDRNRLAVERKLTSSMSTELGLLLPQFHIKDRGAAFAKLRYYPSKRGQSKSSGDHTNNFSGNYFALGFVKNFERAEELTSWTRGYLTPEERLGEVYSASFGRQQKVGKWGYFDISANLQYFSEFDRLELNLEILPGIAIGKIRKDNRLTSDKYEQFRSSYDKDRYMIKVSDPSLNISRNFQSVGLSFGYEQLIFNQLSFNSKANLYSAFASSGFDRFSDKPSNSYSIDVELQLRYYFGANKKLRRGENVENLTGYYLGLGARDFYRFREGGISESDFAGYNFTSRVDDYSGFDRMVLEVAGGIQQRIGKKAFFDFGIDVGFNTESHEVELNLDTSIGLMLFK